MTDALIYAEPNACIDYWGGTAPFCHPDPCKFGWHQTQESKTGDGKKCLTGHKIYCQCDVKPNCQDFWSGTAPFCKGSCPAGYKELYQSSVGNGGLCFTGHKSYCGCDGGGTPPTCQKPIVTSCFGFLLTCNNGCSTFICGFCFKGKGQKFKARELEAEKFTAEELRAPDQLGEITPTLIVFFQMHQSAPLYFLSPFLSPSVYFLSPFFEVHPLTTPRGSSPSPLPPQPRTSNITRFPQRQHIRKARQSRQRRPPPSSLEHRCQCPARSVQRRSGQTRSRSHR